jgi:amylosucrase/maltose alpha-D-glucosyltransferase/alpha-amylase
MVDSPIVMDDTSHPMTTTATVDARIAAHGRESLARLLPRLEERFIDRVVPDDWQLLVQRIRRHFPNLFHRLYRLYGDRYDFFFHLEEILATGVRMWLRRPVELKALDATRDANPDWFQSNRMFGAVAYIDLFAGNLHGLRERIPYLTELGVTYLHLMPPYRSPGGDDDGGYAVSSYRELDPELGTMAELTELASDLRHQGISLALDFVFNHTSDEHEWARRALTGDSRFQAYYRLYPDREEPDAFEASIIPIFPDEHPGCFTYRSRIRKWVWTTFHHYQWDLNYENPEVFAGMAEEALFLANQGVEVLRLDAVAFLWKRMGTSCQNLPEAHLIIQAFNQLARIAAPAVVFKSEAIVHPDEVSTYIHMGECQLSYNPLLMALLWEALATRKVSLLRHSLQKRFTLPDGCAWVNYVRSHDDIGWTFSDDDARQLGITPQDHRRFLSEFFTGAFPGSFARGLPFQRDPVTGDVRVSGTTASLCGLEKALESHDDSELELAIAKILLLYGVITTIGGIPLLYLGDELATPNDLSFRDDPSKEGDTRWAHRPRFDPVRASERSDPTSVAGRIHGGLLRLVQMRRRNPAFGGSDTEIVDAANDSVFAYFRHHAEQSLLVLANFSESEQVIEGRRMRLMGCDSVSTDLVSGRTVIATRELQLAPYKLTVLSIAG